MKILTTGLSGLVGSRIAELLKDSYEFEAADLTTGFDLTNEENVQKTVSSSDAEIVLHLAAFTDVGKAEEQRGDESGIAWKVNVTGTRYLVENCNKTDKRLINISTDYVFKGDSGPYSEDDETIRSGDEGSWYGWTKLQGEKIVQDILRDEASIVRLAYPFRAKYGEKLDFMRKMIKSMREKTLYPMFTDQLISPTFIDDIALALKALIDKKATGIYHVVGSSNLSPYEIAVAVTKEFEFDANTVQQTTLEAFLEKSDDNFAHLRYPKKPALNNKKINELLGQNSQSMKTFAEAIHIIHEQGIDV